MLKFSLNSSVFIVRSIIQLWMREGLMIFGSSFLFNLKLPNIQPVKIFNQMRISTKIEKLSVNRSLDIYEIMQLVLKREHKVDKCKEHFWVIALNNTNKILNLELVSTGCSTAVVVKPMEVLSIPLQKRALGVILVHNHPSGKLEPSENDKDLTDRLIQCCRIMNTPVLDHVIITTHSYYSFKDSGLLDLLEHSNKYVPPYELEKQYFEEMQEEIEKVKKENEKLNKEALKRGLELGEEKGIKLGKEMGVIEGEVRGEVKGIEKGKIEIAKNLLNLGFSIDLIMESTGLTKEEVEKMKI